ncbi:MAG: PAS domain-containing protein [Desulfuromonadaceae bacterium]|nr:PAS domain-containing protein [Desulfuromonadaceae bacterium]
MPTKHASHRHSSGKTGMAPGSDKSEIDALKQAQQALTREKEFSRCLLESMADGVVACDADGILTLFNRSAREWHGLDPLRLPPEEWARHFDLFRADGITPLPTDEVPLARAFRGEIVRDAGMAIKAKDRPIRFILANGSVIRDEDGNKLGAVVVMRDVTEFRRLELELRTANEELEQRVEERTEELRKTAGDLNEAQRIAHIGSWELDLLTNRLFWSDEIYRIFEINPNEFGASYEAFLQAIHPDDREAVNAAYTNAVRNRASYSIEHRLLLAGGRIKHVHEHCETFYAHDKPIRSAGTIQDITERKRTEEALYLQAEELEEEVTERQMAQENLQEKALLLEEEIEKHQKAQEALEQLNVTLELRVKERTTELEEKIAELHRMNKLFVGRELRMVELKERIRELENVSEKRSDQND